MVVARTDSCQVVDLLTGARVSPPNSQVAIVRVRFVVMTCSFQISQASDALAIDDKARSSPRQTSMMRFHW
jgi:hypothetical protein